MNTENKCPHCGGKLNAVGQMTSGNSKYDLFECEGCCKEVMKCIGLVQTFRYS